MSNISTPVDGFVARTDAVPVGALLPWPFFVPLLMLAIDVVGAEEGATSIVKGMGVHEFVHDGCHLLGFPYH